MARSGDHGRYARFPFPGAMLKLLGCIWKVSVPLRYMASPPTVPERDELMEADGRGGRRPKKRGEQEEGGGGDVTNATVSWPSWLNLGEVLIIWWCFFA